MTAVDYARIQAELKWLQDHPEFEERPATITEFMTADYLNIEGLVRESILLELREIVGTEIRGDKLTKFSLAMITGGIGIGKTTIASIILPYMAHWVLCLKNPQKFFDLLPGSRIAFMQMSTSGDQAKEVIFGDVKARIEHSPWFTSKYPFDSKFKNQIRFPKDIWILPGDSEETTFEGYNILGGILDEADSHKMTKVKDYAEQGYTTISSRIKSRFGDRGFLLVIGQMKRANGFAARKYNEFMKDPDAYAVRMSIWESFGWNHYLKPDGTRDSFWYDTERKEIISAGVYAITKNKNCIEVPVLYRKEFENNPEKALRDLAGIPPATGSPFISLTYKITEARERWKNGTLSASHPEGLPGPVDAKGVIQKWFHADTTLKRVCHIDIAYSEDGDALGFAMAHIPEMVVIEGERKPFIQFDLIMRIHAPAGREIFLGDVRRMIYELKDERKFRIVKATLDGFQSTDTMQQLERRRISTDLVSVDKQLAPYYDLREALYENRIAFPELMVRLRDNDTELTEIAVKELMELVDDGAKVDHPEGGSKDVADAMAGCVYTLMGDRSYHRRTTVAPGSPSEGQATTTQLADGRTMINHPALVGSDASAGAPIPPSIGEGLWRPPTTRR